MIACDNDDCPREWVSAVPPFSLSSFLPPPLIRALKLTPLASQYHYNCVGLESVPRGRWYCLFCAPPGWKGPGGDVPPNARYAPPGHKSGANKGRK